MGVVAAARNFFALRHSRLSSQRSLKICAVAPPLRRPRATYLKLRIRANSSSLTFSSVVGVEEEEAGRRRRRARMLRLLVMRGGEFSLLRNYREDATLPPFLPSSSSRLPLPICKSFEKCLLSSLPRILICGGTQL